MEPEEALKRLLGSDGTEEVSDEPDEEPEAE
jgi:hypothetical protein